MSSGRPLTIQPSLEALLPIYGELYPRAVLQQLLRETGVRLYWRILTPVIVVWCLIWQRLQADQTCDAVVSHLHSGAVDALDPLDKHPLPLSQRLRSESTSAYVQARQRVPLALLHKLLAHGQRVVSTWLRADATPPGWRGHAVRLLDGTSFRLRPVGDLVETYGQAHNQHGTAYWVTVQSVAAFCLDTQMVVAYGERGGATSENALVRDIMAQDPEIESLYVADRYYGVYHLLQLARAYHKHVLLRLTEQRAHALLAKSEGPLHSGQERRVVWTPTAKTTVEADLSAPPVPGRLLYIHLQRDGFRPLPLYLFTSLLNEEAYPLLALVELYGRRWQVEVDYRRIKCTLQMTEFAVQSAAMFRKELAAGLLSYNLICACMVKAGLQARLRPTQLSFARCLRRVRDTLQYGVPAWVTTDGTLEQWLLARLARCRLPQQPNKVPHEPRRVRRQPALYPALKGDRDEARRQVRAGFAAVSLS